MNLNALQFKVFGEGCMGDFPIRDSFFQSAARTSPLRERASNRIEDKSR